MAKLLLGIIIILKTLYSLKKVIKHPNIQIYTHTFRATIFAKKILYSLDYSSNMRFLQCPIYIVYFAFNAF